MEIHKEFLKEIKKGEKYKNIVAIYNNINKLTNKDPINQYLTIKKELSYLEKKIDEIYELEKREEIKPAEKKEEPIDSKIKELKGKNLSKHLVKELREICKNLGIKGYSKANKATLIKKINDKIYTVTKDSGELTQQVKEEFENYIQSVNSKIPEWKERFKNSFTPNLERSLKQIGYALNGHYPELKTSIYTLEINFDKPNMILWYGPKQEKIDSVKLKSDEIVNFLKVTNESLVEREFNDKKFISNLLKAYKMAVFREEMNFGEAAPIMNVLLEFIFLIQNNRFKSDPHKYLFTDYTRAFFSYDLYRLRIKEINNVELKLVTATRAFTKEHKDFLWIPTSKEGVGNYYSHIKFEEKKY